MEIKVYNHLQEDIIHIRNVVFVEEQKFTDEFDDIDDYYIYFVAYEKNIPVATCRIYKLEDKTYAVGRVAVLKEYRGKGIGKKIMQEAEQYIKKIGGISITLSAQVRVQEFYEKIGYVCEGETYLDQYCPHIRMKKKLK